jgi:hypothetical protein
MAGKNYLTDFLETLSGPRAAFVAFIAAGGYFLWTEHQAHLLGALPYLILLLCPLMHIFMHRGHGGHGGDNSGHDHHDKGGA